IVNILKQHENLVLSPIYVSINHHMPRSLLILNIETH
ncbi:MAG: hypothetical protein ACI8RD_004682, partial [Bacillariaceae sp.]